MNTKQEKNVYFNKFLDDLFFKDWKIPKEERDRRRFYYSSLELIITPDCNLACTYCYLRKQGHNLYPKDIRNYDDIVNNTRMLIDWLIDNEMVPGSIDLFSGSVFSQRVGWEVLEIIYDKYKKAPERLRPEHIMVPTNFTFILDDEITKRVSKTISDFEELGIKFHLSASVEGKYMEQNRPFKRNLKLGDNLGEHLYIPESVEPRDDEYYDKVFKFCKEHKCGMHPMVYSKDIDLWKKNFEWFQEMFKKHNLPFNSAMLLEVRDDDWSTEQVLDLVDFIEYAVMYVYENVLNKDKDKLIDIQLKNSLVRVIYDSCFGENILAGITCALQQSIYVRLGDMHLVPCHRTSYKGLEFGKFITDGEKVTGLEGLNVELMTQILTFDHRSLPMCTSCVIKEVCKQTCLGSNLESTGELFSPAPSVCRLSHGVIYGSFRVAEKLGILEDLMERINPNLESTYWLLKNKIFKEEY